MPKDFGGRGGSSSQRKCPLTNHNQWQQSSKTGITTDSYNCNGGSVGWDALASAQLHEENPMSFDS